MTTVVVASRGLGGINVLAHFGAFDAILRNGGYNTLLDGVRSEILVQVHDAIHQTSDLSAAICRMLDERNWRTDLVAIAAVLLSDRPTDVVEPLWEAFDYGSWVAPQFAVCLYLVDPDFRPLAKRRITGRCAPASPDRVRPGPWDQIAAKNLASLLSVLHRVDDERAWIDAERLAPDVQTLLRFDIVCAEKIADRWLEALSHALAEAGRPLGRV